MGWEECGEVGWRERCGEWDGGRDVGSVYKQAAMVHVWCSICTLTVSTEWSAVCTHGH